MAKADDMKHLPGFVKREFEKFPEDLKEDFYQEYKRKRKSVVAAYLCWLVGLHYAYVRNWGTQIIFSLTLWGMFIWWIVDLFRVPELVRNYNKDVAIEVAKNIKIIAGNARSL